MPSPKVAPYGSWVSPITASLVASGGVSLGQVSVVGQDVYWVEARPAEKARYVVVHRSPDGTAEDMLPAPFSARTRVHEYGGLAWTVVDGVLYFANFADQRLYRLSPGAQPVPLTPAEDLRYADPAVDRRTMRAYYVREDHTGPGEAVNTLVCLDLTAGGDKPLDPGRVVVSGSDFYSNPRLSPEGLPGPRRLCWLTWNHPNLPWDGTEAWVGDLQPDGSLANCQKVAGGPSESIFQPEWSPDGTLHLVSDRSGWWNLYRWRGGEIEALYPIDAEFGVPQWTFGASTYGFASPQEIICLYNRGEHYRLARLNTATQTLTPFDLPFTDLGRVVVAPPQVYFLADSSTEPLSVVRLDLGTQQWEVLRRAREVTVDRGYFSVPQEIEFPTEGGLTAYGNYYPPLNPDFTAPEGEKPPLLVMSHGGPTAASGTGLNFGIQYWTSRGIAVLDVNYGGSTGYGRAYRERLNGNWGVVDMDDCANGALYLVRKGLVDGDRLAITGGSAGGYTTLCALTFRDVFKAGASHFGIGDLETFAGDTHKFESRYLDSLVGPYPEKREVYRQRSPINYIDRLNAPMILLQGLEDKIVPPNQAEAMFAAVRAKGLPVAYLPFEGEQHGFRKAENIQRALEAELYFYSRVFGFELGQPVEPVKIENL
jgi:dipeptidyl aminopeptidase/acylaminoacyl peptidase